LNKVIIITGASSGIGKATALRLAREGMSLTLAARRRDELEQVAARVRAAGGQALVAPMDVTDHAAIHAMVQSTLDQWGRVDVLVNNAGMGYSARVADLEPDRVREQISVNLIGVIECAQAVLPAMFKQSSGHIVNIASIAGLIATPRSSTYAATKFGVVGFSDALRRELRGAGVRVTTFCPGFVATGFSPRLKRIMEGQSNAPRLPGVMRPEYVAERIAGVIHHPRSRVIVPRGWGLLAAFAQAFPWLTDAVLSRVNL
jgi:short-subunit dehydrogenase